MCGCGAEDLPWETRGSVDAGYSGEPEVDSPSSSYESMVNSFGGSGTEIPSPCGTGRRAGGIFGYTIVHFSSRCLQKQVAPYRSSSQLCAYLGPSKPQQTTSHVFCHSATAKDLLHVYGSICARPRICLASEIQMIRLFHYRGDGLSLPCERHFIANVTKVTCTVNTVTRHH